MTRQRPLLIAVSCLALACPVQLQVDLSQSLSIALAASTAMAKEGNNGNGNSGNGNGGVGNGNGNGNTGRDGNSGNSGSNGNANGNDNGGSKGSGNGNGNNGNGNGNGGSKGNAGGNGADNGNGKGNGNGNQGGSANAGQSNGQGQSSGQTGSSSGGGESSGQRASRSQGSVRSSPSPIAGGLSAFFGAIAASLRAPPPDPLVPKRAGTRRSAKAKAAQTKSAQTKSASARISSRQPAARHGGQEDRTKAGRAVGRSGMVAGGAGSVSSSPAAAAYTPAGSSSSLPKPARAERSIVATGLSPLGLNRLKAQGFQAESQTRGTLASVTRLVPPRGMSLSEAQRKVRMTDAGATADFDHFYYTDEGQACTGPGCEAVSLVGWNIPPSQQCGPVPTIGLIDTGIDRNHEALQGQSVDVLPMPQMRGAPSQRDHGTAVAALLVGRSGSSAPGLLPQANLVAVDAFYRDGGTADRTDVTTLVAALEALSERHVRIVNLSLSGPPNEVLKRAIVSAQEKGMIIVAAAGNNGPGAAPSYPAAYPGVIAVTAVDRNLAIYNRATQGEYIDLAAPGVDLWVAAPGGGGASKSGTSYAVPFISAAAAVLSVAYTAPDATTGVRKALEGRTRDLGKPGRDKTFGYGLLQAADLCQPSQDETPVAQSMTAPGVEMP